ncbi:MAG: glycogen synthase GlgA [Roseobacter sp.]
MNVLFVASECAPFVKTGGLADVIGAVPKALAEEGVDARVLLPGYPALKLQMARGRVVWSSDALFGGPARVVAVNEAGLALYLLDAPHLYDREGSIYLSNDGADWDDNDLRFAALSRVGADLASAGIDDWHPDIVHAHDWQAGLVPLYLRQSGGAVPPTVLTIHNIAFQGLFDADRAQPLGIDAGRFHPEGAEFYGRLGFLKAGLAFSDKITTVSPTYARELLLPEFGMGLEGVMHARRGDMHGILNGIDTEVWNPETDPALPAPYSARKLAAKKHSRHALLERFGLSDPQDGPIFCVISRLTRQKGLDLLLEALPAIVARGGRLAILGTGDKDLEDGFKRAAEQFPGHIGAEIGYDEALSHLMQGGSDAIVIPSRFEPCGLTQLYGLRYGTLPVVARTGGLADTVIDANEAALTAGVATGVQFAPVTTQALEQAIHRTCDLFAQPRIWAGMQRRAMRHPVGWEQSAVAYGDVYKALLSGDR